MGPDSLDFAFIVIGAMMLIFGCVLYFVMEIWPQLKADARSSAALPVLIWFGTGCLTNGLVIGYGTQMSVWVLAVLTAVSIISVFWYCVAILKLFKAVYSKQQAKPA